MTIPYFLKEKEQEWLQHNCRLSSVLINLKEPSFSSKQRLASSTGWVHSETGVTGLFFFLLPVGALGGMCRGGLSV